MKKLMLITVIVFLALVVIIPAAINWQGGTREQEPGVESGNYTVSLLDVEADKVVKMPLEEYLIGVVAAEMPAKFEPEALKAQAITARTYTAKRKLLFGSGLHHGNEEAEVCTDPTHCQAWLSEEQLKERWGMLKYPLYIHKIKKAVAETAGKVVVFEGKLADPVYHGSCGGAGTEDSENVWKYSIPYLRRVECSWDDMTNPALTNKVELSLKEFAKKLNLKSSSAEYITGLLKSGTYSEGKRLISIKEGENTIPGSLFRNKLGLASTVVTWEIEGEKIVITTKGKGHGVGMCQYGANGMAKAGKNYKEILNYYYKGIQLADLDKIIAR